MLRRSRLFFALTSAGYAVAIAIVACSPAPRTNPINARDDVDGGTVRRDASPIINVPDPPKPEPDPILPDGGKPPGRVYAHTADTLYLFNPLAKTLTVIGKL